MIFFTIMNVNISMIIMFDIRGKTKTFSSPNFICIFSLLLVSPTHLFILRKLPDYKTMANLVSTRPLSSITKITSKSKTPEIITFHSTISPENEESNKKSPEKKSSSKDCDKVYIPNASDATKYIKFAIVKALNML